MIATAAAVINVILVKESPASVLEDLRVIALTRDRPFKSLKKYLDATNDQKRDEELRGDEKSGKTPSSSFFLLFPTMAAPTYLCPCQIRIFITGIHSVRIFRSSETDNGDISTTVENVFHVSMIQRNDSLANRTRSLFPWELQNLKVMKRKAEKQRDRCCV